MQVLNDQERASARGSVPDDVLTDVVYDSWYNRMKQHEVILT